MESVKLIEWFEKNGREYPWRKTKDPYKILVSEILLQKTNASQVDKIYKDFFNRFESIEILKNTNLEDIEDKIERLGLVKRARFLKEAASMIVNEWDGKIPEEPEELRKVNGIGRYTANAIASFAFEKKVPTIDSNVARIFRRYFRFEKEKSIRRDEKLWEIAQKTLPQDGNLVRKFNMALIDLGALVCSNQEPNCEDCPLEEGCLKEDSEHEENN